MTKIEWTGKTWNPVVGCSLASPGCTNCYAMRQAHRLSHNPATPHYAGTTQMSKAGPVWTGKVALASDNVLTAPLRRRKPTTYFVNSMGDLFHEDVPDEWIDQVFAVMALCPQHIFQVLTKRSARMRDYISKLSNIRLAIAAREITQSRNTFFFVSDKLGPLPNVWLGVSVEDQRRANERIPDLLDTLAAVRFVSMEPLLGPVNLLVTDKRGHDISALRGIAVDPTDPEGADEYYRTEKLDWVICGGESGPGARPMYPDWARALRDQCVAAGVPFFFKQWGEWAPIDDDHWSFPSGWDDVKARERSRVFGDMEFLRVGKSRAGRLLDGREWSQMPAAVMET